MSEARESLKSPVIPDRLYFKIGDVANIVGVKPHVLRYWESEFSEIQPEKSLSGQRVYRRKDVETVLLIKRFLYSEKYSVEGARNRLRELRREGDLASFKREAGDPMPASERVQRDSAIRQARGCIEEVEALLGAAYREIFKY